MLKEIFKFGLNCVLFVCCMIIAAYLSVTTLPLIDNFSERMITLILGMILYIPFMTLVTNYTIEPLIILIEESFDGHTLLWPINAIMGIFWLYVYVLLYLPYTTVAGLI